MGDSYTFNWAIQRGRAFAETIQAAGFECHIYPDLSAREQANRELESRRLCNWLRNLPKPVAVMAARDVRARQVLDACISEGLSVPHQVSVLGVDNDEPLCKTSYPPLSSIQMETKRAGYLAAELLHSMMQKRNGNEVLEDRTRYYGPGCVIPRASTDSLCIDDYWVTNALEFIRTRAEQGINVADVVRFLGISRRQLELRFRKQLRRSVLQEIHRFHLERARTLLLDTDLAITEIAQCCGFDTESYLGKVFRRSFGLTMSEFRFRHRVR